MIDKDHFDGPFLRIELQSKLLLKRRKDRGRVCIDAVLRREVYLKIKESLNAGSIEDHAPKLRAQHASERGHVRASSIQLSFAASDAESGFADRGELRAAFRNNEDVHRQLPRRVVKLQMKSIRE